MKKPYNKKQTLALITALTTALTMTMFPSFSVEVEDGNVMIAEEIETNIPTQEARAEENVEFVANVEEASSFGEENEPTTSTQTEDAAPDNAITDTVSSDRFLNRNFGYIPEEDGIYDFDHVEEGRNSVEILRSVPTESYYVSNSSSRGADGTPVLSNDLLPEDQGMSGMCWVYSSNKAVEFNLALKGNDYKNISEKNTGYYFWHKAGHGSEGDALLESYQKLTSYSAKGSSGWVDPDRGCYNLGGNPAYIRRYFQCWKGLVPQEGNEDFNGVQLDEDKLYSSNSSAISTPDADAVYSDEIGHVNNVIVEDASNSDGIKELIKTYGACVMGIHVAAYDGGNSYPAWNNPSATGINHQIAIIGWDDNYSKENFPAKYGKPENNGAWYCMNSWGRTPIPGILDNNGCFWLSYEDGSFKKDGATVSTFDVSVEGDPDWEDHNYREIETADMFSGRKTIDGHYANHGNTSYGSSYTIEGADTAFEKVSAIGFETFATNTTWTIKTYEGSDSNGTLVDTQTVTIPRVGYHRIALNKPFVLYRGHAFYVEIQPADKNYEFLTAGPNNHGDQLNAVESSKYHDSYGVDIERAGAYATGYIDGNISTELHPIFNVLTCNIYSEAGADCFVAGDINTTYGSKNIRPSQYFTFIPEQGSTEEIQSVTSNKPSVAKVNNNWTITVGNTGTANVTIKTTQGRQVVSKITVAPKMITQADIYHPAGIWNHNEDGTYTLTLRKSSEYYDAATKSIKCPIGLGQIDGRQPIEGRDYTVAYYDNTKSGTARAVITGKGNYTGSVTQNYRVIFNGPSTSTSPEESVKVKPGDTADIFDYVKYTPGEDYNGNKYYITDIGIWENGEYAGTENNIAKIQDSKVTFKDYGTVIISLSDSSYQWGDTVTFEVEGDNDSDNNGESDPLDNGDGYNDDTPDTNNNEANNDGNENNESEGSTPSGGSGTPSTPEPEPDPSINTVAIAGGEYTAEIQLPKTVPFTKSKKDVVNYVKSKLVTAILASDGGSCGITVKSVKATKPKKGVSKVTIKLKGSTKAEKKAVKAMNKRLKNIVIAVETE